MADNSHTNLLFSGPRSIFQGFRAKTSWANTSLFLVLLISLVLKLTVWATVLSTNPGSFLWDDAARYQSSALSLVRMGRFFINPEISGEPQYAIPPGYPLILAALYAVVGEREEFGVLLNIFFSLATIAFLYRSAYILYDKKVAILAAWFLALDLSSFSYSLRLFSETVFTLFLVLVLYSSIRFFQTDGGQPWMFLVSVFLTCATFVRSIGYYLIIPIGIVLLGASLIRRWKASKIMLSMFWLTVPFIVMVGAWKIHNYYVLRSWQFCPIAGYNMFYYRAAAIVSLRDNISLNEARQYLDDQMGLYEKSHPETHNWTKGQYSDYWMSQGLKIIMKNPLLLIRTEISGIIPMLAGGGDGPVLRMLNYPVEPISDSETFSALKNFDFKLVAKRFSSKISLVTFMYGEFYLAVIYLGVLIWMWSLRGKRHISVGSILILVMILYFFIISAGPEAGSRFRVPTMPSLALLAASGWDWLKMVAIKRKETQLSIAETRPAVEIHG